MQQASPVEKKLNVLLLAESSGLALQAIYCLHELNVRIFVVGRRGAKTLRLSRYCSGFTEWDYHPKANTPEEFCRWLKEYLHRHKIDVIVPIGDLGMNVIATIREKLPVTCFPIPTVAAGEIYNDKWSFHELCTRAGVPVPKSLYFESKTDIKPEVIEHVLGFPCVVKPTREGDGVGVEFCRSRDELFAKVLTNEDYDFAPLIAQELVPGLEIDLNTLAIGGKAVAHSAQYRDGKRVVFVDRPDYAGYGSRVLAAGGYEGLAHFDAIQDSRDGVIKLLECNARSWASISASAFCGLNFFEGGLRLARGESWIAPRISDEANFLAPAFALLSLFGKKYGNGPLSKATLRGLASALGDPMPFASEYFRMLKGRFQ